MFFRLALSSQSEDVFHNAAISKTCYNSFFFLCECIITSLNSDPQHTKNLTLKCVILHTVFAFFQSVVSWQMLHLIRATSLHTEPHVTDSTDTWNRLPYLGWCFSVIILMHFGLIVIVKHLHLPQFTYSYTFD